MPFREHYLNYFKVGYIFLSTSVGLQEVVIWLFCNLTLGLFPCHDSATSISRNDVCNGRYECDRFDDEISCGK